MAELPNHLVRRQSLGSILRTLHRRGPLSRAELAIEVGLSNAAVSRSVAVLQKLRLIQELAPKQQGAVGRRRIPIWFDTKHYQVLGVHVGVLRTTLGLVTLRGEVVARRVIDRSQSEPAAVLSELKWHASELIKQSEGGCLVGIGIALHGQQSGARTLIPASLSHEEANEILAQHFQPGFYTVDTIPAAVALGESWFGCESVPDSLAYLYVAAISGVGLLLEGRPHRGSGRGAGSVEHLQIPEPIGASCYCGRAACFSANVGNLEIIAASVRATGNTQITTIRDVVIAARTSPKISALLRSRARNILYAADVVQELLDPGLMILGGDAVLLGEDYIVEACAERARSDQNMNWKQPKLAALRQDEIILGPATLAITRVFDDPINSAGGSMLFKNKQVGDCGADPSFDCDAFS